MLLWFEIAGEKTSARGMLVVVREDKTSRKDLALTGDPVDPDDGARQPDRREGLTVT